MDRKRYYSLVVQGDEADIYIYGDITSWPVFENDVSSYNLAQEIKGLEADTINVYINSYGGEVAEGLAIYNALRRHKAKVRTVCDGFACSAASVVFMAGDERVMSNASLLMIHNAWMLTMGDQNDLRKNADDLEIINAATIQAYLNHVNISEDELKEMMDAETWISAADALEMGFATAVVNPATTDKAAASLRQRQQIRDAILSRRSQRSSLDVDALAARLKELMAQEKPEPEPEPEPRGKGLFVFMAALANKLREGAE
jgi:ATP-dependent Clp protease protease subunit